MQPDPQLTLTDALDKLAAQGTSHQVAEYLEQVQALGRIGSPVSCPLACYLDRHVEFDEHVIVGPMGAHVVRDVRVIDVDESFDLYSVDLPEPVAAFVAEFDDGLYPDLEDPNMPPWRGGSR